MALVESGEPLNIDKFDSTQIDGLTVYIPKGTSFAGGIPKIVDFPRNNGWRDVGVSNVEK